ncbi:MAG: N-6 DNA methylase [Candidatus Melainabacteria bacterium]|nr:N-6 DNA methylase [Candidatus Melainabacteria bacterium]
MQTIRKSHAAPLSPDLRDALSASSGATGQVALVALLALAFRGILPEPLAGTGTGALLERVAGLFGKGEPVLDSTEFARLALVSGMESLVETVPGSLLREPESHLPLDHLKTALPDPLYTGWVHESLMAAGTGYRQKRASRELENLASITQWFTPSWISDFLVAETAGAGGSTGTFLDPACGAGHILVPALASLIAEQTREALPDILEHRLFGLDIDERMIELAGFAVYLFCRDLTDGTKPAPLPLPLPNLYRVDSPFGSLALGLDREAELALIDRFGRRTSPGSTLTLPRHFDRIALNPPYLSYRLMPEEMVSFLRADYPGSHYDLYAAFLDLTMRLLTDHGAASMICQQSFLSISRYESLRKRLLADCRLQTVIQLGAGSFASRGGEKVNNAIVTFKRRSAKSETGNRTVRVLRLLKTSEKEEARKAGLHRSHFESVEEERIESIARAIPGSPVTPFCPEAIARLFTSLPSLADTDIVLTNGLFTCDNRRFLKDYREITGAERHLYVPYDKGGGRKWFATTSVMLRWEEHGKVIREFRKSRGQSESLPGESHYFREGITYSYIGTRGFKARLLSPGSIFDIASSALFTPTVDRFYLLGFLNSALCRFILGILNPTVNFQIGDLRRIPFKDPGKTLQEAVAGQARKAVAIARHAEALLPGSPAWRPRLLLRYDGDFDRLRQDLARLNAEERQIQETIDSLIFELYGIASPVRELITGDDWVTSNSGDLIDMPDRERLEKALRASV